MKNTYWLATAITFVNVDLNAISGRREADQHDCCPLKGNNLTADAFTRPTADARPLIRRHPG